MNNINDVYFLFRNIISKNNYDNLIVTPLFKGLEEININDLFSKSKYNNESLFLINTFISKTKVQSYNIIKRKTENNFIYMSYEITIQDIKKLLNKGNITINLFNKNGRYYLPLVFSL